MFGWTSPDGKIIELYPDAFRNKEILVKTLGHERIHVMKVKLYGAPMSNEMGIWFEGGAEISEQTWWNYFKLKNGVK